jgi:hypothetical protein
MLLIKVGNGLYNPAHIAKVERTRDGIVEIRYPAANASGTDLVVESLYQADAKVFWDQFTALDTPR